ncbi:leader peptidase [Gammaproteobacteria bacterium]|nr:leader peptidase [Gammaproteobacteria bacterium]
MAHLLYYLSISMIIATPITGFILLIDKFFLKKNRAKDTKLPWYIDWSSFLFPVVAFVSIVRCFIGEPFTVPTGSMQPTIYGGDMIIADKWSFGMRYPLTNERIFSKAGEGVNRGDIAIFKYPEEPRINYVKRIIGIPGDVIDYKNKRLTINQIEVGLKDIGNARDPETDRFATETIGINGDLKNEHSIQFTPYSSPADMGLGLHQSFPLTVPDGMYFAMGDNRDNSLDSRFWGFVPDIYIIGKAHFIWMNYNCVLKFRDCSRIFTTLK